MPTNLLFYPAKFGPFGLAASFVFLSLRKAQGVDYCRYDGVCARNHIHFVEKEDPEIRGDVAGDPVDIWRPSTIDLDGELFGLSHKAGVMPPNSALADECRAKLLPGQPGPEVSLSDGERIAHPLGATINPASSPSWHDRILQTLLRNEMQLIIAKAA